MKKSFLIATLMIILMGTFSPPSFSYQNEPDGFRGLKWGTSLSELSKTKKMTFVGKKDGLGIESYAINGDKLSIGDVKVKTIQYDFLDGKLARVMITLFDGSSFHPLWNALKQKYGDEDKFIFAENTSGATWNGKETEIMLANLRSSGKYLLGYLSFSSKSYDKIIKQREAEEKQKAAEKAGKDF